MAVFARHTANRGTNDSFVLCRRSQVVIAVYRRTESSSANLPQPLSSAGKRSMRERDAPPGLSPAFFTIEARRHHKRPACSGVQVLVCSKRGERAARSML